MDTIDTSIDEFFGAFEGADGNQTDTPEDTAEPEITEEPTEEPADEDSDDGSEEAQEEPESDETAEEADTGEADKDVAEGSQEHQKDIPEQKFVVKVNKETREVSYQDAPAWIQKGMDYDRVKGQLETAQQEKDSLQAELDAAKAQTDILKEAAAQSGVSVEQLLEGVHIGVLKAKGMSEAEARAELRNMRLEKQIQDLAKQKQQPATKPEEEPAEDPNAERAQREMEEFARTFPDVELSKELVEKLVPDVQKGMSLTSAYLKQENERLKAEAQQQKQQEAVRSQNKKNRAKTPGSQNDSGGKRTKDATDDFFSAFEK
jgi:hypothetical protein